MNDGTPPVTGGLKNFKWTNHNVAWLRARAEEGKSTAEIAALAGTTKLRIKAACTRNGIKTGGRPGRRGFLAAETMTIVIPAALTPEIKLIAAKRRQSPHETANELVRGMLRMGVPFLESLLSVK